MMLNDPTFWMGFGFGGFLFSSLAALIVARLLDRAIAEVEQDDEHWEMDTEALKVAGRYYTVDMDGAKVTVATPTNITPAAWRRKNAK